MEGASGNDRASEAGDLVNQPCKLSAHNSHNSPGNVTGVNSVDCVHAGCEVETLLSDLAAADVRLSVDGAGQLAIDAPAHVLTDDLLSRIRSMRDALIAKMPNRMPSDEPKTELGTVRCPFCGGVEFDDRDAGLLCVECLQLAWLNDAGGLVRADWAEVEMEGVPWSSVPCCSACGGCCDRQTVAGSWYCSRCDPLADRREKQAAKVLQFVQRSKGSS